MTRAALALLLLAACDDDYILDEVEDTDTDVPDSARAADVLALTGDATLGESTFTTTCAGCHNADGSENIGPGLADSISTLTPETALSTIIDGDGGMPAYGYLSDEDLADLWAYLTATWGA